jgi:hypothetical protein
MAWRMTVQRRTIWHWLPSSTWLVLQRADTTKYSAAGEGWPRAGGQQGASKVHYGRAATIKPAVGDVPGRVDPRGCSKPAILRSHDEYSHWMCE